MRNEGLVCGKFGCEPSAMKFGSFFEEELEENLADRKSTEESSEI